MEWTQFQPESEGAVDCDVEPPAGGQQQQPVDLDTDEMQTAPNRHCGGRGRVIVNEVVGEGPGPAD